MTKRNPLPCAEISCCSIFESVRHPLVENNFLEAVEANTEGSPKNTLCILMSGSHDYWVIAPGFIKLLVNGVGAQWATTFHPLFWSLKCDASPFAVFGQRTPVAAGNLRGITWSLLRALLLLVE